MPEPIFEITKFLVTRKSRLHGYLSGMSVASRKLYNATLFRARQVLSGAGKPFGECFPNEREVFAEIDDNIDRMNEIRERTYRRKLAEGRDADPDWFFFPTSDFPYLRHEFIDTLFKVTGNPDYRNLPAQTAQNTIRMACGDMESYRLAKSEYDRDSSKFLGKPKVPGYAENRKRVVNC